MNLKKVTSGPVVSPNSSVKAAFSTSSKMWCRQAIQRICLLRSPCRMVQQPLTIPVLNDLVHSPVFPHWRLPLIPCWSSVETSSWVRTGQVSSDEPHSCQRLLWESPGPGYNIQRQHCQGRGILPGARPCRWRSPDDLQAEEEVRLEEFVLNFIVFSLCILVYNSTILCATDCVFK